jgi:omega-hydroxy-beta-dihydromenaquinone-9 sulfotransferase
MQKYIKHEDILYKTVVEHIEIKQDPVFIIGHWRSGTTYLHNLISLDTDNFSYPTTYQAFFPTVFLTLNEDSRIYKYLQQWNPIRRWRGDNIEIDFASPQEEEFMYMPEGGFSYSTEKLIFPETAISELDQIFRLSTDQMSRELTLKIFKKLTYAHDKRIISKSPGHFSRIPVLNELFPRSKFIFIITAVFSWIQHNIQHGQTTREHPDS